MVDVLIGMGYGKRKPPDGVANRFGGFRFGDIMVDTAVLIAVVSLVTSLIYHSQLNLSML